MPLTRQPEITPAPAFHRGMLDDFPTLVWATAADGKLSYVNRAWLEFTGRTLEQELEAGWFDCVHPDDRDAVMDRFHEAIEMRQPFEVEYRLRRGDGAFRWVIDRGNPLLDGEGVLTGFIGFCYDTTERRAVDSARREIEEQARLLGLATRDMIWSWDVRSDRVINNPAFAEGLGDLPGPLEATINWWNERVHPDDRQHVVNSLKLAIDERRADASYEYRFRRRDGTMAVVDDRVCLVYDFAGKLVRVLGAMRDISERKRAEEAQARLSRILESTSDFVGMTDAAGHLLYVNRAGRRLLGWPLEGAPGTHHLREIFPGWAAETVFEGGIPVASAEGTWTGETAVLDSEGREVPVSQVIVAHAGSDGEVEFFSTIMRDISDRKREEVARIEWANRYDAAIRASGQLLFDWNSITNEITYGGDSEAMLGFSMREMEGGLPRLRELIHADDLEAFDLEIARVTATRDPFHLGFRMHRKDGSEIAIDAKGYFFLDRQGRISRMVGFLADVTEQRHAQEQLSRAHENLEARVAERTAELARAYVVIQDRAMQQETVAHLGQEALAGARIEALFDEGTALVRTTLKVDLCAVMELTPDGTELKVRGGAGWPSHMMGGTIPAGKLSHAGYTLLVGEPVISDDFTTETRFEISQPVRDVGGVSGICVVIQTEQTPFGVLAATSLVPRVFTQDDTHFLQSVANVLTAAIDRQRAEERIRQAQQQAEGANRAKSEFLSRMSHELRTPLNAILGFTQLLEIDSPSGSQAESISHISRAGQHLLSLINEVLDIARIEAGRFALSPESVDVASFLTSAVELIRPLAARYEVTIILDPECAEDWHVMADRQRMQQVVLNLLSNAVKYNRRGGSVTVRCEPRGESLRICVQDTGHGIPPEKLDRLFVPFERLGAESTDVEGTGIGLALSQRIATALHGELGVESEVGVGSTFWLELPLTLIPAGEAPPVEIEPELTGHGKASHLTLLYVEDQDLNLRLVERILLHRPEYKLLSAMQGGLAIDLAREHKPDLILLDLNLPDMSGEEVLRRLKQDPQLKEIPVVMVSADAMGDRISSLLALGAHDYLTKPYRVAEFFRVIEKTLNQ